MRQLLQGPENELLGDERRALRRLDTALRAAGATQEHLQTLGESIDQLDQLFLLVIVGEFNSGKSTLINALVGAQVLPEGVTPTTQRIHRIGFGATLQHRIGPGGIEEVEVPADCLNGLSIVDTPGTNAIERDHEALTQEFVPNADLVLFVTSADRPFTESERLFMEAIRSWGKKLVLAINKIDILSNQSEAAEVSEFVGNAALQILGQQPPIFPVSARQAYAQKTGESTGDPTRGVEGFENLESYLVDTLDETERVRLKLSNPLGVGRSLCHTYEEATKARLDLLADDSAALDNVGGQLDHYRDDMKREFRFRLRDVDAILLELERRGIEFFDETLRLPRAVDLFNKAKIQADFERQVIGDAPRSIEKKVHEIIDWMVSSELRQWQAINAALELRRSVHRDRIIGDVGTFDYDRDQLLNTVGRAAASTVDGFDQGTESARLAESVRTAIAGAALIEVGALSLGTLVTMLATTQLADFTGLLAAGTLAIVGLLVLPTRRRQAKRELAAKTRTLRDDLMSSLTDQFDRELERSLHRIWEAISPYSRFVRSERSKLENQIKDLQAADSEIESLAARISRL